MEIVIGEKIHQLHKESFLQLARDTFGLQFEQWDALGYWDHTYRCYAMVNEGEITANVSVSFATMVVDGQPYKAAQIGTVMTNPKYRGLGLSKKLMLKVMEDVADIDIVYLFANATVLEFYPKFGFEKRIQATFTIQAADLTIKPTEVKRFNIQDANARNLFYDTVKHRSPVSSKMAMLQNENIVMFHALTQYANDIYYVPAYEAFVIAKQHEDRFQLIDVIAKQYIALIDILQALPIQSPKIQLCFTPDTLPVPVEQGVFYDEGAMFVKEQGALRYPNDVLYPYSALA